MWVGQKAYIEVLDDGDAGSIELDRFLFLRCEAAPPPERPNALADVKAGRKDRASTSPEAFAKAYQKLLRETVDALGRDGEAGRRRKTQMDRVDLLNAVLSSEVVAALPGEPVATSIVPGAAAR